MFLVSFLCRRWIKIVHFFLPSDRSLFWRAPGVKCKMQVARIQNYHRYKKSWEGCFWDCCTVAGIITDGLLTPDFFFFPLKKYCINPLCICLVGRGTRVLDTCGKGHQSRQGCGTLCLFPGNAQEQNCKIFILCIVSSIMQNQ